MVSLELARHAPHHPGRHLFVGLFDLHHLKAPRQRRILLEVFLVLRPGRRADRAQLSARERWLEQVGGVVLSLGAAGSHHGVDFVDEEDDRDGRAPDLLDHLLESVLEFPLDPGPGLQQPHVELAQADLPDVLGHVSLDDALGEALDHGGLAHTGLAGEDRVVLTSAAQDVDHLPDLGLAREHGVHPPLAGLLRDVSRVAVQGGCLGCAARAGCGEVSAGGVGDGADLAVLLGARRDVEQILLQRFRVDLPGLRADGQQAAPEPGVRERSQQNATGARAGEAVVDRAPDPAVASQLLDGLRQIGSPGIAALELVERSVELLEEALGIDVEVAQDARYVRVAVFDELEEPVFELDVVVGT